MRDTSHRPFDPSEAAPSNGDPIDDVERAPGLVVVAGAVLAFGVCVVNFALGQVTIGIAAAIAGMLALGAGLAWLSMERRRVRQAEREWSFDHPDFNQPEQ